MNLIKWSIIAVLFSAFVSIDAEPANASTGSASNGTSLTQNDKPQKHRNRKRHLSNVEE